ncbi:SusC/RagA family TonB-linked outer membrane protein [Hymenobacter sp. BT770]|uniref:SusC/RagA family TonB-linked outer membrane protein n=1 Tax=Hymenobacter sp. BT770 TaxID=2886942 RepID=UPI001D1266CE|nr:SusC/RagA family TonB-linked outer membrane protein [Hymenobacter sp. BT770]MCC3153486.1 SusC/RagA family TonB-linked outer membrane protein [Hymenobacter sp. BT770]MDO3415723.1 SusC/RagA family TonB-linked outer membrane protein [Hymenobacter sp. BT770]
MKHHYLAKLLFLLLFAGFGFPSGAFAQTGSVSGRVTDSKNEGIPGATVLIEGTSLGSSSAVDGTYSIQNVPAGPHTVVISFVGYNAVRLPVTVTAGANSEISAKMTENATQLSEAVVVGYGTQRRQDVTGAVATVDSKQFVQGQVTNPEQLIQGKVAGVAITTTGGAPGTGTTIRIRGNSSLNANSDPLYVIDGVPVDKEGISGASNPLSLINPNDIETFTVLKDASATAIYGNRASGGVILITTKRGLQGDKLHVELNSQVGVSTVARRYEPLSADQFRSLIQQNGAPSQYATLGTANTNWQNEIFRTAGTYDNTVSLTGSVAKVPFRVSYGNLYQEGIVITNNLKRNSGSVSLTPTLLDNHLRIDINAKGTMVDNRFVDYGTVANAALYDPTQPITSSEGRFSRYGGYYQFTNSVGQPLGNAPGNPVAALNNSNNTSTVKRLIGNVQLDYKVHGIDGLRANLNLGLDASRGRGSNVIQPIDFGNYNSAAAAATNAGLNGKYTQYAQDKDMHLLEAYLAYGKQLGGTKVDVQGGYAYQTFQYQGPNFLDYRFDRTTKVNKADTLLLPRYYGKLVMLSYFGRATMNVKDKYLVTATLRNDRTSRFREGYRSGWFPALGLAWRVKNEDFLKDNNLFSELKLRAGYGRTGQQDLGNGYYDTQPRYILSGASTTYPLGNTGGTVPSYSPQGYNAVLTWETTNTYNAGLDLGFLDNRLTATVDVYQRTASDLLARVNFSAGSNLTNQLDANIGSLRNRGIEVGLNYGILRSEDLNWDVNLNGAYNENKITDLGQQAENFQGYKVGGIGGGTGNTIQIQAVGHPINSFFTAQQVYGANGRPVEGLYVDKNGDGIINDADYTFYKQPAPLVTLGFSSNVTYKKLFMAFTLRSNLGNYVYNANAANFGNYANAQGSTLFVSNLSPDVQNTGFTRQQLFSDYYVQNASFLRCENISLGYNVGKVLGASSLRVTANVQNAFLITKYKGVDPEVFGGIDTNFYPRARTFTLGLALGI